MINKEEADAINQLNQVFQQFKLGDKIKTIFERIPSELIANKFLKVKSDGSGIELVDAAGGVTTFIALTDTPGDFGSQALKALRVNAGENALEFVDFPSGGAISEVFRAYRPLAQTINSGDNSEVRIQFSNLFPTSNPNYDTGLYEYEVPAGGGTFVFGSTVRLQPTGGPMDFISNLRIKADSVEINHVQNYFAMDAGRAFTMNANTGPFIYSGGEKIYVTYEKPLTSDDVQISPGSEVSYFWGYKVS